MAAWSSESGSKLGKKARSLRQRREQSSDRELPIDCDITSQVDSLNFGILNRC